MSSIDKLTIPIPVVEQGMIKSAFRDYQKAISEIVEKEKIETMYEKFSTQTIGFDFTEEDLALIVSALLYREKKFRMMKKEIEAKYYRDVRYSFKLLKRILEMKKMTHLASESIITNTRISYQN